MLAVKEGRDDLAKQALMRQGEHVSHGQQLEQTWETHRLETEKLKNSLRDLNDKIEEAKRKKNLLVARQRRAQAQKRIAETMSSMSEKSAFDAFARMEERIETNERQLKASIEIEEEFTGDRLAQDFKQLEKGAVAGTVDVAADGAQAEDGHAPCRFSDKRAIGAGRRMKRPSTLKSRNREREENPLSSERHAALQVRAHSDRDGPDSPASLAVQDRRSGFCPVDARRPDLAVPRRGRALDRAADAHAREGRAGRGDLRHRSARSSLLVWILAPPVIDQTRQLIQQMPKFLAAWEAGIDALAARIPALRDVIGPAGEHRTLHALYGSAERHVRRACRRKCSRSCTRRSTSSPSA